MLVTLGVRLSLTHTRQVICHWVPSGSPQLCLSLTGKQVRDDMEGGCTEHQLWILAAQGLKTWLLLTSSVAYKTFSEKEALP